MTYAQTEKFLQAVEAAEIEKYSFDVDDGVRINHDGEHSIIKYVNESIVGISRNNGAAMSYGQEVGITVTDAIDCHKAYLNCNYDQAKTFLETYGVNLSNDELKIVMNIYGKNVNLNPETGDYVHGFHYLSKKEYDELSPEEKEAYDASKKKYEEAKEKYIGVNQAASITL